MWYNGITKFDLFNWIDESNIETNEKNDLKTRINTIERGDGGLFEDLPDTYKINIGSKNGVSCLHVLNKRRYGEEKKKSIFDLMLKRSEWKERLLTQLKEFASEIKDVSIDESIEKTKKYLAYRKLVRRKLERVLNVVAIICALMALPLFCMVIADAIVSFDNDGIIYKFITPATTLCGILDFIFGVYFANIERAEDDRERAFMVAIANDQKKSLQDANDFLTKNNVEYKENNYKLEKKVEKLQGTNEELQRTKEKLEKEVEKLQGTNEELRGTKEKLEKEVEKLKSTSEIVAGQQEKLEQKEAKLGICEQCHVPLGQVCNICGHKHSTPSLQDGENAYIHKDNNANTHGYRVIEVGNEAILVCDAEMINLESIYDKSRSSDIDSSCRILEDHINSVKKIVFTEEVKNIILSKKADTKNVKDLFPGVKIVGFAKPQNGSRQYHLGENVFAGVEGIEIIGSEYIVEEGNCF